MVPRAQQAKSYRLSGTDGGQPDQLRGHARHALPRVGAEQCEPDLGEHPRVRDATLLADDAHAARISARRGSSPRTRSATYASIVVLRSAGASWYRRPRAVVALAGEQVADRPVADAVVGDPEECEKQHMLGGHGHVGLELARPPAGAVLQPEEMVGGALDRLPRAAHGGGCALALQRVSHERLETATSRLRDRGQGGRGGASAAHGRLHRRRPAGGCPGAGDDDVGTGASPGPADAAPGEGTNVASGSRVAAPRGAAAPTQRAARQRRARRGRGSTSSASGQPTRSVGGAQAAAEVARLLLEHPLHRRADQRGESRTCRLGEPEVDVDDGADAKRSSPSTP